MDFSSASSTKPSKTGTALPATCSVGETFFKTDATAGQNLYGCTAVNVWTLQSGGGGGSGTVTHSTGALTLDQPVFGNGDGDVKAGIKTGSGTEVVVSQSPTIVTPSIASFSNAAHNHQNAAGGGVLTSAALSAASKQGTGTQFQMFGGGAANSGECIQFDGSGNVVSSGSPCGTRNHGTVFSSATSVVIAGTSHAQATANLIVECYDDSTPATRIEPDKVTVDPSTYDVTITFAAAQSGLCVVNGSGGGGGGSGAVSSVFGRTGNVAAQSGDYQFSQISGTVSNAQIASGVDAVKVGAGAVSNTEFGHLDGVTSSIQTQLNGKASSSHSHAAGGDATGDVGAMTVIGLQNRVVASTAPSDQQVLVWNASLGQWEPGTMADPGAGSASQLADFQVTLSSSTILTIGADCSPTTPCNVRFGGTTYTFTTSATATLSSGTGTAYIYITPSGALTVGHNLTLSCSGCTGVDSVTSFPTDSVPVYTWTATSGTWDTSGGADKRGFLSRESLVAGTGVTASTSGSQTTIAVDSAVVGTRVAVPSTPTSTCISGQWAADATHFYVCYADDDWRRVATSSW